MVVKVVPLRWETRSNRRPQAVLLRVKWGVLVSTYLSEWVLFESAGAGQADGRVKAARRGGRVAKLAEAVMSTANARMKKSRSVGV